MRSDRRKELAARNGDHWAHHDPGVRQAIREACADAWDEGYVASRGRPVQNPYRDRP